MKLRGRTIKFATLIAVSALLVGCASTGNDTSGQGDEPPVNNADKQVNSSEEPMEVLELQDGLIRPHSDSEPVSGGTFSWYSHGEPRSLDPAVSIAAATTGGIEMLNIFDSITRWNAQKSEFEPQTASSVESNDDFTEWTITLQEGISFSNGEVYNAEAVKQSQERYASMPAPEAALWNNTVEAIEVLDPLTIKYSLSKTWRDFPSILSTGPGMIVAPGTETGEQFSPVGAGPFTLDSWVPTEELILAANPDYWDGAPHLERVRSVYLHDVQTGVDSLIGGQLDGAFALQANFALQMVNEGYNGHASSVGASNVALINAAESTPGNDVRVRKAIQLAVDPQIIMDRVYESSIPGDTSLFPESSRWATPTRGDQPNVDESRKLLEEAKADGFDGRIQFLDGSDSTSRSRALVVQAQLEAVGFDVEINYAQTVLERVQAIASGDYHVAGWSINFRDADPTPKLFSAMHSSSTQTYGTYTSSQMDALIEQFQTAMTEEEQKDAMNSIQQQLNEDVPFAVWSPYIELLGWSDDVQGIEGTSNSMVFFNGAWLDR